MFAVWEIETYSYYISRCTHWKTLTGNIPKWWDLHLNLPWFMHVIWLQQGKFNLPRLLRQMERLIPQDLCGKWFKVWDPKVVSQNPYWMGCSTKIIFQTTLYIHVQEGTETREWSPRGLGRGSGPWGGWEEGVVKERTGRRNTRLDTRGNGVTTDRVYWWRLTNYYTIRSVQWKTNWDNSPKISSCIHLLLSARPVMTVGLMK